MTSSQWSSPVELVDGRLMVECRCSKCPCADQVVAHDTFAVCDACANGQHVPAQYDTTGLDAVTLP